MHVFVLFPGTKRVPRQLIMIMNRERGALQGIGSKKACFWLPLGGASPRLLRPAGVPLGDTPPRLPVELRPAGVLPVGGASPRLPVELRPAGVPLGDAPPRLPVELRPAGVLPVGGAPRCCRCRIAHCFLLVLLVVRLFPRR